MRCLQMRETGLLANAEANRMAGAADRVDPSNVSKQHDQVSASAGTPKSLRRHSRNSMSATTKLPYHIGVSEGFIAYHLRHRRYSWMLCPSLSTLDIVLQSFRF